MSSSNVPDLLKGNSSQICGCINELKKHRDEVTRMIKKQEEEKVQLTMEMERLTYKYGNLTRSLAQRLITRDRYNEAIAEAEEYYLQLVESSNAVLNAIEKDYNQLYESMDKKVGTEQTSVVC